MSKSRSQPVLVKLDAEGGPPPICPYCEKELAEVQRHQGNLNLIRHLDLFACPHCRKVLGTAVTFK
jgi:uncharacterized protein with PIN domain